VLASTLPARRQAERIKAGYRVSKLRAVAAFSRPRVMDNILEAFEKCVASMTIEQRDEGDLHSW